MAMAGGNRGCQNLHTQAARNSEVEWRSRNAAIDILTSVGTGKRASFVPDICIRRWGGGGGVGLQSWSGRGGKDTRPRLGRKSSPHCYSHQSSDFNLLKPSGNFTYDQL
jgi:hypothetical protein